MNGVAHLILLVFVEPTLICCLKSSFIGSPKKGHSNIREFLDFHYMFYIHNVRHVKKQYYRCSADSVLGKLGSPSLISLIICEFKNSIFILFGI